jgi:hypothetical protein
MKSLPKYLLIVLAFAGDSTITSDFAMCLSIVWLRTAVISVQSGIAFLDISVL